MKAPNMHHLQYNPQYALTNNGSMTFTEKPHICPACLLEDCVNADPNACACAYRKSPGNAKRPTPPERAQQKMLL